MQLSAPSIDTTITDRRQFIAALTGMVTDAYERHSPSSPKHAKWRVEQHAEDLAKCLLDPDIWERVFKDDAKAREEVAVFLGAAVTEYVNPAFSFNFQAELPYLFGRVCRRSTLH